ncbi:MAG: hypothetical protein MJ178_02330 [Treponemataceae bacterium]|nr:hypothetical protein [Treponemataceae bacterium]
MSTTLLVIDPQNDFSNPKGSLYVPGAAEDCNRLSEFILKNIHNIDDIHVTLDSHLSYHIAHPIFWKDQSGNNPVPYTIITYQDYVDGKYRPVLPELERAAEEYLLALENRGRYSLCIWPLHCILATWGFCVEDQVNNAIHTWEHAHLGKNVNFIRKAANPLTEHYSAIQAEVPDPNDPSTRTNFQLIDRLKESDSIIVAGEALTHCLANTIRDLAVYIPAYRITILTDCTSPVAGFEQLGEDFIKEFKAKGMQFETTETFEFK